LEWFSKLHDVLRDVRVTCGDWSRVVKDSVTTRHGLTAVFLDPPYTKGAMDYTAQGTGGALAQEVQAWCIKNGHDKMLRIVLCGHAGEHDILLEHGWHLRTWTARKGYATTDEAIQNSKDETLWCSPHCVAEIPSGNFDMFEVAA
jgi:site-specific DNA-adenine methylase